MPLIDLVLRYLRPWAREHTRTPSWPGRRACACLLGDYFLWFANLLTPPRPEPTQNVYRTVRKPSFWIRFVEYRRHRCPQTWSQDLFFFSPARIALNGSSWKPGAGATVCQQKRGIYCRSQLRMRIYLYPHKRMTASEQPNSENFQLCFWRGIPYRPTSKEQIIASTSSCRWQTVG